MYICEYDIVVQYMPSVGYVRYDQGRWWLALCTNVRGRLNGASPSECRRGGCACGRESVAFDAHRHQTRQAVRALVLTISVDRRTHFRMVLGSLPLTRDDWKDITIIAIRRLEAGVRRREFAW